MSVACLHASAPTSRASGVSRSVREVAPPLESVLRCHCVSESIRDRERYLHTQRCPKGRLE